MESHFRSEFFAGNRQRLRELFTGTAPIVITANGQLQRGGDNVFTFAQDASFWYLTGIDEPDIVLVLDRGQEYLIVPRRSATREAFDGAVTAEMLISRSGINTIYDEEAGWKQLASRLKKAKHATTLAAPPPYIESHGFYINPARAALIEKLKAYDLKLLDLTPHLIKLRVIKQPAELAAMQAAIDITIATLKEVLRPAKLRNYKYEYEVEADLSRGFRRRGASGHAFDPVVASGGRASILHNQANQGTLSSDELLLLDVGAEMEHYAADLTRTVSLSAPSKRQRAVYAAVLEVHDFALKLLQPGTHLRDYEQQVEHFMGEKLRELGLIKTINHDNVRRFYPHATSHFLGLNTHDIGDVDRPLEPNMVLTVEPGIYIPAEDIGVRIEDDILITAKGHKILTAKLPHDLFSA